MSWENVKLNDICTMLSGNAWEASKFKDSGIIPIIRIQNLGNNENEKFIWWDDSYDKKFVVKNGDLLLSLSGSIKVDTWKGEDALLNQRIVKLIPNINVDSKWFYWQITNIILDIERMGKWALVNNVSISDLKDLEIPLPPLTIQKRIAEILDAADALKRKDQELLKKYDELAQAIFMDMFGDPVRNEKGWEVGTIQGQINLSRPITYGILKPGEDIKPNGIPYIRVVDIKGQNVLTDQVCYTTLDISNQYKRSLLKEGDILYSIRGHVGRSCLVPKSMIGANITQDTARLDFTGNLNNVFAFGYLNTTAFDRIVRPLVRGAAVKGLNLGDLRELPIPIPPTDLQTKYQKTMNLIWVQINIAKENYIKSESLFQTFIQKAFSGELVN